jgi:SpoVK/Ycf46/Vps4 family AAA+-type ATPase
LNSHFNKYQERFFFLYGKTSDEFCLLPKGLLYLEEVLHRHLLDLGYQRILFYNGKQKLYFFDHESKQLCRPNSNNDQDLMPSKKKSKICAGPLGMKKIRKPDQADNNRQKDSEKQSHQANDSLCYGRANDLEMVGVMDYCMRDLNTKTALIFTDGLDFIFHTEPEAIRQMGSNLNQWAKESSSNQNICIFVLPEMSIEDIKESLSRAPQWLFLKTKIFTQNGLPGKQMIPIGYPQKDEVENLIHYARLKQGMKVNWLTFKESITPISRKVATHNIQLKELSAQLKTLTSLDKESLETIAKQRQKTPALKRLASMKGLQSVAVKMEQFVLSQKEKMNNDLNKVDSVQARNTCKRLLPKPGKSESTHNLHIVLTGNPGTGKTMSASLIGEIFRDAGLLESGHIVKASKEDLVAGYVGQTALQTSQKISQAMGGVLFIDEAYRFSEEGDNGFGKEAIETIMEAMSNHMGEFCVIAAGYPEKMNAFLDTNPGLKRRFGPQNIIHIPDYSPEDLRHIFDQQVIKNNRSLDHTLERLLPDFIMNWHGARDPETFGNAGDVINLFEEMDSRRSVRVQTMAVDKAFVNTLSSDDIPERLKVFFKPAKASSVEEVLKNLDHLVGLTHVKSKISQITKLIHVNMENKRRNLNTAPLYPGHYIFSGNPGTGKTTVARLMGQIFQLQGLLGRSEVLITGPADFIDKYVGGTEEKTKKIFKKALNGVLFIDEAHQLAEGGEHSYGRIVVKELVPFMLNNRENLCVIVAGYPDQMDRFLDLDPGLKSRFTETISFEDFSSEELTTIFHNQLEQNNEIASPDLPEAIKALFKVWVNEKDKDFGNARDVHKLMDKMRKQRAQRLTEQDLSDISNEDMLTFTPCDIPENQRQRIGKKQENLDDILLTLDDLIGLNRVKDMVKSIINHIKIEQLRGDQRSIAPGHYVFVGNPGTGKTTVARKMGQMFKSLGILNKGHLVEVGRADMVAGYQGQTALKTTEVLNKSLDGVLFIDEAYQLVEDPRDSFGKEALETLVAFMENHRDRLCIIVAGYPGPMNQFIMQNPGLPSRFSTTLEFDNYSPQEMFDIFALMSQERKMSLQEGIAEHLIKLFEKISLNAGEFFGNGREVRKIFDVMISRQANRLAESNVSIEDKDVLYRLDIEDVPEIS